VHGGVLALLLETMTGQAVLGDDQPRLVSKLAIAYRGPVPQDADLVLEARVTSAEDTRWRVTTTLATAADPATVLTECQGTVLQLRPDQLARHRALQA
jgi:acyl-coenzyme A thioesterase PaaI-like protein